MEVLTDPGFPQFISIGSMVYLLLRKNRAMSGIPI